MSSAAILALLGACAVQPRPFTAAELGRQAGEDRADMLKGASRSPAR